MKNLLILCALAAVALAIVYRSSSVHMGGKPVNAADSSAPRLPNDTWLTDFSGAKQQAASENKKILMDFTGSDWCYYCQQLDAEVLSTQAFKNFAKDFVLMRVDFPHSTQLSPEVKKQNDALAQEFGVDGFPTLVELNSSGREITRQTGYQPGSGPQAYLSQFK